MTRKRYIKLLMACGMSRNVAAAMAKQERADGLTYAEGWAFYKMFCMLPDFKDVQLLPDGTLRWVVKVQLGGGGND